MLIDEDMSHISGIPNKKEKEEFYEWINFSWERNFHLRICWGFPLMAWLPLVLFVTLSCMFTPVGDTLVISYQHSYESQMIDIQINMVSC